ncbi:thioredoxin family protein [Agriterribacter sp.]|uniref:thioredoxin family protein n=1 Tax=Agriterribacter sp. TaxID=2821509 RepID=UPI002BDF818C|nr:thioredoxin family protein [Agriterribacter sp.]HRO46040.1 thioredoxin family protein [Agriterribacter sp.]HRQ17076.1 thioredoxin family protein [Agriterribacter sp.]
MQISGIFLSIGLIACIPGAEASAGMSYYYKDTTIITRKNEKLEWLTLAQAEAGMATQKKDILIDLYTDWCGWCKVMDRNTYTNPDVIQYLNDKFYPVKLNAETKEVLTWRGRQFKYNDQYRVHDYAILLTGGQLSYPSTVILPADGSAPQVIPGYLKPPDMELVLKYFGEDHYGKTPFETYRKDFIQTWK